MNVLKKVLGLAVFALLVFPAVALASDEPKLEVREGDFRFEAEGDELKIRDGDFRFEVKADEFKTEGMVTAVGGDSFAVDGFTVMADPAVVEGDLMVGAEVEAEGMVVDGVNFAEEVKVDELEEAEDIDELEIEDVDED